MRFPHIKELRVVWIIVVYVLFLECAYLVCTNKARGQAFTPRRPFIPAVPAAGAPFNPSNIAGLWYWWNADDLTNLQNQAVNSWTDRIQGVVFTNVIAANRPIYTNYGVNFNGSTYLTNYPGVTAPHNAATFVALSRQANANADYYYATWSQDSAAGSYGWTLPGDSKVLWAGHWVLVYGAVGSHLVQCSSLTPYNQLLTVCAATGVGGLTNGVLSDSAGWFDFKYDTFGGYSPPMGSVEGFVGPIYEIILYTNLITATDVSNLNQYAQQWIIKGTHVAFTSQPRSIACLTNTIQSMTVTATGTVGYRWQTNNVDLSAGSHWFGVNTNTLWITNDATLYSALPITCIATNQFWNVTSSIAYLTVQTNAMTTNLAGWWKMNEGTGTNITDFSGAGNTGNLTNASWSTGYYGNNVVAFNGTTSVGMIPDADGYTIPSTGMSISFFVNLASLPPASPNNRDWLTSKISTSGNNVEWGISVNHYDTTPAPYGRFVAIYYLLDASKALLSYSTTAPAASTWYHVCVTYPTNYIASSGTPAPEIYVNGAVDTAGHSTPGGSGATGNGNSPVHLAAWPGDELKLNGSMYDYRIYSRVLTTNEISILSIWRN